MAAVWILMVVVIVNLVTTGHGYPTGAPLGACLAMRPGHIGISPQTTSPPFRLTVSKNSYSAGDIIKLTITATGAFPFVGFLVQARLSNPPANTDPAIGSFTPVTNSQTRSCFGKPGTALTHTNAYGNTFTTLAVDWTAPTPAPGDIYFKATIAKEKTTYWMDNRSPVVTSNDPVVTVTTASDTPAPTTAPTSAPTSAPATQASTTDNTAINLAECGTKKGCLRVPPECTSNSCSAILTWKESSPDYINFEIGRNGTGWVAAGLSHDSTMGDDSVMECLRDNAGVMMVSQSKNKIGYNIEISKPKEEGIDQISFGYVDGFMVCRFRRQKLLALRKVEIYDLSIAYHLLLARGVSYRDGNSIEKRKHVTLPSISSQKQLLSVNSDLFSRPMIPQKVKAHGCFMIVAWVILAIFGMFISRYFKDAWKGKTLFGKDIWFPLHAGAMALTVTCTLIGFIIIFVHVNGFTQLSFSPAILNAHPVLGIIVTCLALTNPVLAFFRPKPDAKRRPIFNWSHWLVGTVARILSLITIMLGLNMPSVRVGAATNAVYVMIAFICFYVLAEIILQIHRSVVSKKVEESMDTVTSSEMLSPRTTWGARFPVLVLYAIIVGLIGFGFTLIIMILLS